MINKTLLPVTSHHVGRSHHQSFVHEELFSWSSIVVLGVDGEAEE